MIENMTRAKPLRIATRSANCAGIRGRSRSPNIAIATLRRRVASGDPGRDPDAPPTW